MQAELIDSPRAILGEGPIWFQGRLYWVDIEGMKVWISKPAQNEHRAIQMDKLVSAVVPRQNGGLVVTLQDGFYFLDPVQGECRLITDPLCNSNVRFNDGKCDAAGRFWAGSMAMGGQEAEGSLYVLEVDHTAHHRLGRIGCSNGICWSHDQQQMYYIDTVSHRVDVFDYSLSSGHIANRRPLAKFNSKVEGVPDGMTIDAEGNLWIALWGGAKVVCVEAATGNRLAEVSVPVSRPTACAFGGDGYETLYITTASVGCPDEPTAGQLFQVQPGVRGKPAFAYSG